MKIINDETIIMNELLQENNWWYICREYQLSEELVEKYQNYINWTSFSMNQKISDNILEKYCDKLNWNFISIYQDLDEKTILKWKHKVIWKSIYSYQKLSFGFIIKNINYSLYLPEILRNSNISLKVKEKIVRYGGY